MQMSSAKGQRVLKLHPTGGLAGLGISPCRITRGRFSATSGSGTGTAEINAWEAARYMAMGVMAHKSALRDGERLDVPDFGDPPKA